MKRLLLLAVLTLTSCGSATPDAAQAPTAVPTAVPPTPTTPPAPTATPAPTNTPKPTATPRPTNTPKPTATPEPPPEPIRLTGTGQTVTDPVQLPDGVLRVLFAHDGARNFIVKGYSGNDEEYLANAIGRYAGMRPLVGDREMFFEVNADGGWLIQIDPLPAEPGAAQGLEGQGDTVSGLFNPVKVGAVPYTFTHDGQRNFIVQLVCAGGSDYVQNEIGAVEGEAVVRFAKGPCFWDVQADGAWTAKPK